MKIAICDDELEYLNLAKKQIEEAYKSLDIMVYLFRDGRKLLDSVRKTKYDLIILDIEMPSLDGLSVARKLRELGEQTALVFLTSHVEYALKGYEVNALRYLTKPVKKEQLAEIINHLLEQRAKIKKIMLKAEDEVILVSVDDVIYMEASNQDICVVTKDGCYMRRYNIRDYEEELERYYFVRCHRSYLVNLAHIAKISGKDIMLDNGDMIPLSRTKDKIVKQALIDYIKRSAL
ncbi:MAG: response regulator transcription factor [Lachnospiraceae bacterium]|nr:response regulator transcription factor [Lachnospiraceae bacterium]